MKEVMGKRSSTVNHAYCPYCDAFVPIDGKAFIGKQVTCKSCKTKLEVSWLNPIELDWPSDYYKDEDEEYDRRYRYRYDEN
jgi:hypothetical protein